MLTQTIRYHNEVWQVSQPERYVSAAEVRARRERETDGITPEKLRKLHAAIPPVTPHSTKWYYMEWVKTIPLKRGDYVVHMNAQYPHGERDYLRVVQIQEIHHFVEFDSHNRPMAMELVNNIGTRFWTNVDDWVDVAAPPSMWQMELPPT